jgi:hypothetical protein
MNISDKFYNAENGKDALRFVLDYSGRNEGLSPELIIMDSEASKIEQHSFLDIYGNIYFSNSKNVKVFVLGTSDDFASIETSDRDYQLEFISSPLTKEKMFSLLGESQEA